MTESAGTRTQDPRLKRPMLYQLSYAPGVLILTRHFRAVNTTHHDHVSCAQQTGSDTTRPPLSPPAIETLTTVSGFA